MTASPRPTIGAPPPPRVRFSLGVTGHRIDNAAYAASQARVDAVVSQIFDIIDAVVAAEPLLLGPDSLAATRLHSLLADGVDQAASQEALRRGWEIVSRLCRSGVTRM